MLFRLVSVVDTPQTIYVMRQVEKNGATYRRSEHMQIVPGIVYDTEGDPVFEKSVRSIGMKKVRWSAEKERMLKEEGIAYKVTTRSCCGGGKKLEFHEIEEVKDA